MKLNGQGPVFGIDIDGTLGNYHQHFINFAAAYTGRTMPDPRDINPALPLRRFLGLGSPLYRQCKLAYRNGGMKRSMPCYPGASELTKGLRAQGAEVWICTSRPYNQLGNIDPDTRHWLRRNGIQYDNVLWGERKYLDLAKMCGERVVAILDDLPAMITQAEGLGIPAVLRDQPYNVYLDDDEIHRVHDLDAALKVLKAMLIDWKEDRWRTRHSA